MSNYTELKKQRRLELVREYNTSGQTKRTWCQEHQIGYFTMCRWQRNLREEISTGMVVTQSEPQSIVPLRICPPEPEPAMNANEIVLEKSDLRIYLPASTSADYLLRILRGLQ